MAAVARLHVQVRLGSPFLPAFAPRRGRRGKSVSGPQPPSAAVRGFALTKHSDPARARLGRAGEGRERSSLSGHWSLHRFPARTPGGLPAFSFGTMQEELAHGPSRNGLSGLRGAGFRGELRCLTLGPESVTPSRGTALGTERCHVPEGTEPSDPDLRREGVGPASKPCLQVAASWFPV